MCVAVGLVLSAYVAVLAARRFLISSVVFDPIACDGFDFVPGSAGDSDQRFFQQHRAGRACTLYLARRGGWAWGAGAGGLCGNVLGIYRGTGMFPVWVSPRIDAVNY
jgi:hypothetical protein